MKFIILALTISVAFCAAGAAVVGTASMGTATWTNASTLAASVCTSSASILFSTIPDVQTDVFDFEFLFTATASTVAALDMGFSCITSTPTTAAVFSTVPTCSTVIYSSALIKVGVLTLTTVQAASITVTTAVPLAWTIAHPLAAMPVAWNTTLNKSLLKTFLWADGAITVANSGTWASTAAYTTTVAWTGDFTACTTGANSFWKSQAVATSFLSGLLALSFF